MSTTTAPRDLRDTAARAVFELSETERGRTCLAALAALQPAAAALEGSAFANLADLLRVIASGEINGSLSETLADYAAPPDDAAPHLARALRALDECADLLNASSDPADSPGTYGRDCFDAMTRANALLAANGKPDASARRFLFLCTNTDDDAPGATWRTIDAADVSAASAAVESHHATLSGCPVILEYFTPDQLRALADKLETDPADLSA